MMNLIKIGKPVLAFCEATPTPSQSYHDLGGQAIKACRALGVPLNEMTALFYALLPVCFKPDANPMKLGEAFLAAMLLGWDTSKHHDIFMEACQQQEISLADCRLKISRALVQGEVADESLGSLLLTLVKRSEICPLCWSEDTTFLEQTEPVGTKAVNIVCQACGRESGVQKNEDIARNIFFKQL